MYVCPRCGSIYHPDDVAIEVDMRRHWAGAATMAELGIPEGVPDLRSDVDDTGWPVYRSDDYVQFPTTFQPPAAEVYPAVWADLRRTGCAAMTTFRTGCTAETARSDDDVRRAAAARFLYPVVGDDMELAFGVLELLGI
jgi:hypothetical protein